MILKAEWPELQRRPSCQLESFNGFYLSIPSNELHMSPPIPPAFSTLSTSGVLVTHGQPENEIISKIFYFNNRVKTQE